MTFVSNRNQLVCVARITGVRPNAAAMLLAGNIAGRKPAQALFGGEIF